MPDVLAIISRAVFEADSRDARVGDILAIDRYTSTHKALEPLADGGRLFLVTVRPPDETLWLVAVLENPKKKSGAWVAAKNATPIGDLSAVKGDIRFASGTGISAKKGALGMSLQTPRTLTAADAALLVGEPKKREEKKREEKKREEPKQTEAKSELLHIERPFENDRERLEWLRDHGTVAHFISERDFLLEQCEHANVRKNPHVADVIAAIDPVQLLARQLRWGLLDELRWPAQEEAAERIGHDVPDWRGVDQNFPYLAPRPPEMNRLAIAGPDGVVFDKPLQLRKAKEIWGTYYAEGDVLVIYTVGERMEAIWHSQGKPFKADTFCAQHAIPGVGLTAGGGRAIEPGQTSAAMFKDEYRTLYFEGGRYYRTSCRFPSEAFDAKGKAKTEHVEEFDPKTGRAIAPGLPPWFAARARGGVLLLGGSFLLPVPERAERSPPSARAGLAAFVVRRMKDGTIEAEGADGRTFRSPVRDRAPRLLITMPERDGLYAIREASDDRWRELIAPDGRTVLMPGYPWRTYWGAPQEVNLEFMHFMEPRDPASSRTLRDCSTDAARVLLDAARAGLEVNSADDLDDPAMPLRPALARWPDVASAVRTVFPSADARLVSGIVIFAMQAAQVEVQLGALVDTILPTRDSAPSNKPFPAPSAWNRAIGTLSGDDGDLAQHLRRVDEYLFDDPVDPRTIGRLARFEPHTRTWWEPLLMHTGGLVWRLFAPGTPKEVRKELRALLGLWASTRLCDRASELRYTCYEIPENKLLVPYFYSPYRRTAINRYVIRPRYVGNYLVVERAMEGEFINLPNATVQSDFRAQRFWHGKDRLDAALALFDRKGPRKGLDQDTIARIAKGTGLTVAAAALAYLGVEHAAFDTSDDFRAPLGLKVADLKRARQQLSSVHFDELYAEAMPDDASDLLEPEKRGRSGESAADRFIRAWNERNGKVAAVDTGIVEQLEHDLRGAPIAAIHAIRVLTDPEQFDHLEKDARWVLRPYSAFASNVSYKQGYIPAGWPKTEAMGEEEQTNQDAVFDGRILRYYLRYLPWAHQDRPVGDRIRRGAAVIGARVRDRLKNPDLLLLAGALDLSKQTDPKKLAAA
ncbi:MAG: hypothetical protein ACXVEF_42655, partial [Polyangiales bacterium]